MAKKEDEEKKKKRPLHERINQKIQDMTGATKVREGFKDSPPNAPGKDPQGASKRPAILDDPNSRTPAQEEEERKKKKKK